MISALGPRGSKAERESKDTHSSLFVSAWPLHSLINIKETVSLAPRSRYENTSAPPLESRINRCRGFAE
jgi:hypothetical protein